MINNGIREILRCSMGLSRSLYISFNGCQTMNVTDDRINIRFERTKHTCARNWRGAVHAGK